MVDRFAPLLARIDDRLIHGQVVVGCCEPLGGECIVVVDDDVAADSLQRKLYRAAVPPSVEVRFTGIAGAAGTLEELSRSGDLGRVVVVVSRARTMDRLQAAGVSFRCVQLGGAHAREGTKEIVPGFFLDAEDRAALRALIAGGTELVIQPVAASARRTMDLSMLEEGDA